jgi:SAM-dependent methyltransferase
MASYREALRYSFGRRVLDLGCGVGYGAFWLASYGARHVAAVDVSLVPLQFAGQVYAHPRIRHVQADALHLPFADEAFDFVFSSQVIEHVPSVTGCLREIRRVLTADGFCLLTTPNQRIFSPAGGSTNPHHLSEMAWNDYAQAAREVFPAVRLQGIPQHCLTPAGGGAPTTKPNALIRKESYRTQDRNLEECENMLCFGHASERGAFTASLPERLRAAADELRPIFWDPSRALWSVLGVYPGDDRLAPLEIETGQVVEQEFRSPSDGLYRIEVDLARPGDAPVRLSLRTAGRIVANGISSPRDGIVELRLAPQPESHDRTFQLQVQLARTRRWWSRSRESVALEAAAGQPLEAVCRLDGRPIDRQLAMRTFHAVMPPVEAV